MTFSLIAMPAAEELAMDHFAPDGVSHKQRDSAAFHKIAGLYLLMLLLIFQFPSGAGSADAQASAAEAVAPVEFRSEDCIQPPRSPHQIKD
ncbi:hypothetical protein [Sphingorhabdus sp. SMR4y]|uniref:hypothetical protein n=1 Tax=Sphingorhabdus sp. SMR4y TaxID=2584094 RepID=UPI000B5C4E5D|nr:hypothetical protein [Sphingorhabdus sp. SMR4y]ASK88838.1 hypothetical protein SPHFLASMR4Y_02094 [Sphingorhabdus sp. SMR4y]